jgi:hypothetical protein
MGAHKNKKTGQVKDDTPVLTLEDIKKKQAETQNKYRVAMKNKQEKINEINALNEEITKLLGAFQQLKELEETLTPQKTDTPEKEPETPDEGEKGTDESTDEKVEDNVEDKKDEEEKKEE